VATRVVVRRVLLAGDQLLRVVELAVRARAHLVDHGRLEVDEHRAGHVLARASLGEEGVERVVSFADRLDGWQPCWRQYSSQHALPIRMPA